ncbi:hypothetical protein Fcan01_22419 [Folsomia candida]|uniref:Uncharacterized protein n=1 Tax=Folsomia candida TaxID=158441 RepID=A0A226DCA2_FOLCA|nr:hypothetical protein Fcan01_22419 [Folsomia candida]
MVQIHELMSAEESVMNPLSRAFSWKRERYTKGSLSYQLTYAALSAALTYANSYPAEAMKSQIALVLIITLSLALGSTVPSQNAGFCSDMRYACGEDAASVGECTEDTPARAVCLRPLSLHFRLQCLAMECDFTEKSPNYICVAGRVAAGRKFATRYPTRYPLANFPYQHGYPRGYPYPLPAVKTTKTDTKNSNFIDFLIKGTASATNKPSVTLVSVISDIGILGYWDIGILGYRDIWR